MISFFKANKQAKGSAASFSFVAKTNKNDQKGDKCFFANFVSQSSWNAETQTGSFKDGKKITIKLSPVEVSGIIDAFDRNISLANSMNVEYVYHDGKDYGTSIVFEPYFKKVQENGKWINTDKQIGFSFKITKTNKANKEQKDYIAIGLTFAETKYLCLYFKDGLSHIYNALYSEAISIASSKKKDLVNTSKTIESSSTEESEEADF